MSLQKYVEFSGNNARKYIEYEFNLDDYSKMVVDIWKMNTEVLCYELQIINFGELKQKAGYILLSKHTDIWLLDYVYISEEFRGLRLCLKFIETCCENKKCILFANSKLSKILDNSKLFKYVHRNGCNLKQFINY